MINILLHNIIAQKRQRYYLYMNIKIQKQDILQIKW